MILKSQGNMTMEAIRRQIGAAIDVVVQVKRWRGGYRRIESITAVEGFSDGNVTRNELFHWEGSPENGRHVATGYQPGASKGKDPRRGRGVRPPLVRRRCLVMEPAVIIMMLSVFFLLLSITVGLYSLFCGLSAAGEVRRMRNSTALRTGESDDKDKKVSTPLPRLAEAGIEVDGTIWIILLVLLAGAGALIGFWALGLIGIGLPSSDPCCRAVGAFPRKEP